MSLIERWVVNSSCKTEGDYLNFKHNGPRNQGVKGVIIRKVLYSNPYFIKSTQATLKFTITSTGFTHSPYTFTIVLPTPQSGIISGENVSTLGISDILSYINSKLAEQVAQWAVAANTPTGLTFTRRGEYIDFNIFLARVAGAAADPDWTITFASPNALGNLMGWDNGVAYSISNTTWGGGTRRHQICASKIQNIQSEVITLCSEKIARGSESGGNTFDPYFIMQLPVDTTTSPGEFQEYVPKEPRFFTYHGRIGEPVDFYLARDEGEGKFASLDPRVRIIIFLDLYTGNPDNYIYTIN